MADERERKGQNEEPPTLAGAAGRYMGYGLTWVASTALFLYLGYLVDRWLGTMPLFLILGAFVGAGAGFYSLYYHLVVEPRRRKGGGEGKS
jgi:F0F1-type ATP synthase assembly protein I